MGLAEARSSVRVARTSSSGVTGSSILQLNRTCGSYKGIREELSEICDSLILRGYQWFMQTNIELRNMRHEEPPAGVAIAGDDRLQRLVGTLTQGGGEPAHRRRRVSSWADSEEYRAAMDQG